MTLSRILALTTATLALGFATSARAGMHDHGGNAPATASATKGSEPQQIVIGEDGIQPSTLTAKAGQPLKLVITRKTDATCINTVVNKDLGISKQLPLNQPVTVEVAAPKAGTYRLACGMGMTFAVLKVQ